MNSPSDRSIDESTTSTRPGRSWCWVLLPILVFIVLRLPTVVHSPGIQDEHWFAIPGWTVWNEGVPRIPYLPTRHRETFFENADRCLMALPPGLFYVQAPFHAFFAPGYTTSRIPSFLAAISAIAIVFYVARVYGASVTATVFATMVFAVSRPLMFTGTVARPDLLCILCGWISILLLWRFFQSSKHVLLIASGFVCGLGGLFHPLALIFAIQAGAGMVFAKSTIRDKITRLGVFGLSCVAALLLWLPLILMFPDEFKSQFFSNVLDRAGPGLLSRVTWPWAYLQHHAVVLWEFFGAWQCSLYAIMLVIGSIAIYKNHSRRVAIGLIGLAWSSIYLTAVVAGIHPIKAYWVYPSVWLFSGFALAIDRFVLREPQQSTELLSPTRRRVSFAILCIAVTALMIPGSGIRTTVLYLRNWGSPKIHGRAFIAEVLQSLPKEGLFLADLSYVYDVQLSGRDVLLCNDKELFWKGHDLDYTAILLTWEGEDADWAQQYDAVLSRRFGSRDVPQSCFVDIYHARVSHDD